MTVPDLLDRFRRPEYTGENRCVPCTVVNVGIATVLSLGVAAGGRYGVGTTASIAAGTTTFVVSLLVIYVRGYLVPGTPRLTERYLPDRLRRRFHDRPSGIDDGADVELALKGVGARPDDEASAVDSADREEGDG